MGWWTRLTGSGRASGPHAGETARQLQLPGWTLVESAEQRAVWRDDVGDVLTLALVDMGETQGLLSDDAALQRHCRAIAEGRGAGLVEAKVVAGVHGRGYMLVHKKLQRPAFTFMGMLVVPGTKGFWVWAVMSGERGTTGVREAIVTGEMLEAGTLTLESYETSWAQDPYDPQYRGVDRSTLRYMSDAEEHDQRFPHHPLSKVRREVRKLLSIEIDQPPLTQTGEP
jgi:hypothetical protein